MGLTKEYYRYSPCGAFNLIASPTCNVCFVTYDGQDGRFVAAGACETVIIWDLRLAEKVLTFTKDEHAMVTYLAPCPDKAHLAAGFSDGTINVYNLLTQELKTVFSGHRTAVSYLAFNDDGQTLASGGKDTEIVTWDLVDECGLHRLSGHKGVVTGLAFMKRNHVLASSSKDTLIKLWDLDTQFCFQTIAAHVTEVWALALVGDDEFLVSGSNDSQLLVWSIQETKDLENHDGTFQSGITTTKAGNILREGRGRVVELNVDNSGRVLTVHGTDSSVEVLYFLDKDEALEKSKKRQKKEKKRALKNPAETEPISTEVCLVDYVRKVDGFKASSKVKSIAAVRGKAELRVCCSLSNNMLELYTPNLDYSNKTKKEPTQCIRRVSQSGHQGEVRAVSFSSDKLAIASAGTDSIKLWNRVSLQCLRTIPVDYALSVCFVPGDRHAIVGLKNGHILVVDLSAGEVIEQVPAHQAEVWTVILTHDKSGIVSGSSDKTVKFWNFEFVSVDDQKAKVLSILHTRTLKLDEVVLSVRVSPCGKLLAAALLDSTVKIFFLDSFKLFVTLYGHKLPVLCSDISSDSALIVTGSADRNVKIWGMDFGDCHKSMFAHDDAVTAVQFVPGTHYFFSCGKDGKIKQWDADKFQKIITLDGHFDECWNLFVTDNYVVSCGKDRCIRLYELTEEPLVLTDEQEEEREKEELATGRDSSSRLPSIKTASAERGAENLMECLDSLNVYKQQKLNGDVPDIPPMMKALNLKTPLDYLAKTLSSIKRSELQEALLLLPLHSVEFLIERLPKLLKSPVNFEIACKTALSLLKTHYKVISNNTKLFPLMEQLQKSGFEQLFEFKDEVGFNLHALYIAQMRLEEKEGIRLFIDATQEHKQKESRKRKKEKAVKAAAILKL